MQANKTPSDCFIRDAKTLPPFCVSVKPRYIDRDTLFDLLEIASGILNAIRRYPDRSQTKKAA